MKSNLERKKTRDRKIRCKFFEIIQVRGKNGKGKIKEMHMIGGKKKYLLMI